MATPVKLDENLEGRVRVLAEQRRRSADWIMREAIREYVEREEARDGFLQEAMESWSEYQATGQHLTGSEVRDWLRGWGTVKESGLPECHD